MKFPNHGKLYVLETKISRKGFTDTLTLNVDFWFSKNNNEQGELSSSTEQGQSSSTIKTRKTSETWSV